LLHTHLITAYTASLSQYAKSGHQFPEIDFEKWKIKISAEMLRTSSLLYKKDLDEQIRSKAISNQKTMSLTCWKKGVQNWKPKPV
jgi:hypothetical protein